LPDHSLGINVDEAGRGPATPEDEQALGGIRGYEGVTLQRRVVADLEDAFARHRLENDVLVIWATQNDAYRRHARVLNPLRRRFV
jgi:hypothetical protein